jgi:3-oxo-5,6-didehydrosuberyl-CoA/3-oxoadipyl-CoA thiolase
MGDLARWAALAAGFPDRAAGATINRFCGSSLSATAMIAHAIKAGDLGVGIACGAESMSRSGFAYMKGETPFSPRGPQLLLDTMWSGAGGPPNPVLLGRNAYIGMIETAQNVAHRYQLVAKRSTRSRCAPNSMPAPPATRAGWPERSCPSRSPRPERPRSAR